MLRSTNLTKPRVHNSGFTLVELVIVMVLLGILSIGTIRFINDATEGFVLTQQRAEVAADVRLTVHRLGRELRNALPRSTRISTDRKCLEFIPISHGTTYVTAPIGVAGSSLEVVPFDTNGITNQHRLAIAPMANIYSLSNPGSISPSFATTAPNVNNVVNLTLSATHQFPNNSPQRRLYVVQPPVSYCVVNNALWRYVNYGFATTQRTPSSTPSLPNSLPNRALVAEGMDAISEFELAPASLTRNGVVNMDFVFVRDNNNISINYSAQLRNSI